MKNFLTISVAIGLLFLASCGGNSPFPGYETGENGSYFKLHKKGEGTVTPDTGGAVFVKIAFKTPGDSVFLDVNKQSQEESYPLRVDKAAFKGDWLDYLVRLHVGDSASFFVNYDSLKSHYPGQFDFSQMFGQQFDTMKYLGFSIKIDSIISRAKVMEMQAKMTAERNKRMEMMQKVQTVMGPIHQKAKELEPELKKKDAQLLKTYLATNHVTAKPDAKGIYYIETAPGAGPVIHPGMRVGVMYTGKFLDGTIFDANTLVEGQDPLYFRLGMDPMMEGFTDCIGRMKQGGKATCILPPKMGYNDSLTRVFDVEVVEAMEMPQQR